MDKVTKTDEEWRKELTPKQYQVARQKGTEPAFTGKYWDNHEPGLYRCAAARATVQARFVVVPILAGKGGLRALLPSHLILLRRQFLPPFLVGFRDLVHSTFSLARSEQN